MIPDYILRMQDDSKELTEKIRKADAYLEKSNQPSIITKSRADALSDMLLVSQLGYMRAYRDILNRRISYETQKYVDTGDKNDN